MRIALTSFLALVACTETSLHSIQDVYEAEDDGFDKPTRGEDDSPEDTGFSESGGFDSDPPEEEEGPPVHEPLACSVDTMIHMVGSAQDCPEDYAAYLMDDGNGPNFICCPLPADDILVGKPPVTRGTSCATGEVITGFAGQYSYRCTPVNADRYQVGSPQEPCYFGNGSSGGGGVAGCADHPHSWDVLQQNLFGSDGCSGYPYGNLFVSHTGKDCEDLRAVTISYNGLVEGDPPAGTPVDMFSP